MWRNFIGLSAVLAISVFCPLMGQIVESPYTAYGLGELQTTANTGSLGMGGVGVGGGHPFNLNTRNSAWLARNVYTTFDIGVQGDYRTLTSENSSGAIATGGIRNLAFGFPIVNKKKVGWTTSVGLNAFSTVNYNVQQIVPVEGFLEETLKIAEGSGGYNNVYWANGVRLGKNIYLGAKGSYLFGTVIEEAIITFQPFGQLSSRNVALYDRQAVGDFLWEGSIGYAADLSESHAMRLGAYYGGATNVQTESFQTLQTRNLLFDTPITEDTLMNGLGVQQLPFRVGAGLSFEEVNRWIIGVDFDYQPWSQYRDVNGNPSANLADQWRVSVGSQITPEWNSNNFLRRMGYSVGAHYENTPIVENDIQVTDFGINFGLAFPISRASSTLNTVVQIGSRGTIDNGLIRENYVKLNLGVNFNQLWFIRSKYD